MSDTTRPTAIGMHIFAGGFTLGVREHFDVACHLESSAYGVATVQKNLSLPCFYGRERWDEALDGVEPGEVDFLYANPPCAVFSSMGVSGPVANRGAWRTDPRTHCWHDVMRVAKRLLPDVWCLESVTNAYTIGRELVDQFTREALSMGYSVTHLFVSAKNHGLCQDRKRFFFVAHRAPTLTCAPPKWRDKPITLGEALSIVKEPGEATVGSGQYHKLAALAAPGEHLAHAFDRNFPDAPRNARGQVFGRCSFQDRKIDRSKHMGAYTGDKLWHDTEIRRLGINEAKAICGYPQDYEIVGSNKTSQLAQAVMPAVGEWMAATAALTIAQPLQAGTLDRGSGTVTRVDLRESGIAPVDITGEYVGPLATRIEPYLAPAAEKAPEFFPVPPTTQLEEQVRQLTTATAARVLGPQLVDVTGDGPPVPGEGSGKYIQRLLLAGKSGAECVALVHQHFAGRKTTISDVYYNFSKLRKAGHDFTWRRE